MPFTSSAQASRAAHQGWAKTLTAPGGLSQAVRRGSPNWKLRSIPTV